MKKMYCFCLALLLISTPMPATGDIIENEIPEDETPETSEIVEVVETPETVVVIEDVVTEKQISLGVCKITAYCKENYPHICNNGDSSVTATGTVPMAGRTVAVDPSVIPYGSEVIINGHSYIAEDCGGAIKGNRVDICFDTHREALNFGVQHLEVVYVIKEDN